MGLEAGTKLGPYEILSPLGAGGMGEVYRARDTKLDRDVAIKVLPADVASSPERLQRFEREAKTVAALNHPNIVTIYGIEESGGHRFIAMELVEGATLDRVIAPGGMPLAKIFDIAIPLADALAAAHDKGIVHRDLKPANVMVTEEGRVKVLDFGLAKLTAAGNGGSSPDDVTMSAPLTGKGMIIGTVPYMSPEQLKSDPLDHRTDLFSLGIILYEMATGQRPFKGQKSAEVMSSILRDTPRPLHELNGVLPRHLGRVVASCLKKDSEERYQTAKDVRNELRELRKEVDSGSDFSESQPVSVHTSVSPPPSSTSSTSLSGSALSAPTRRGEFWIGVGVLVVVIALAAWWIGSDDSVSNKLANFPDSSRESVGASVGSTETPTTEDSMRLSDQPAKASITLAVLPFKNLGSPDDEYFSDGISDEIRGRLAKVRKLGVISRSSAFQYKASDKTNRQIGSELGVDYLIDGTIRWDKRGGDAGRVRITPELIRISDDMSLWSEPYDRQTEDIFEVQSDIATQVLNQLQITLLEPERRGIEERPTENADAYHAYLRGLVYLEQTDWLEEEYRLAIQLFERAVSLDPSFALAYVQLSKTHSNIHLFGHDSSDERAAKAKSAVDRAFEIQPDLPEAYIALGFYHYRCHRDYDRALEAFRIAQKDLPNNSEVLDGIAYNLRRQGKLEETIEYLKRAFESDPLKSILPNSIGETYTLLRRYPEAEPWHNDSISLAPDQQRAYYSKTRLYWLWHGRTDKARATLENLPAKQTPESTHIWFQQELFERNYQAALDRIASTQSEFLAHQHWFFPTAQLSGLVHGLMGESERSREAYDTARILLEEEARKRPDDHRVRSSLGVVYAALGRKQDAIREGNLGVELFPVSKDALVGPSREEDLAFIYTLVGELDLALDKLEYLLSIPSQSMSVQMIRLDPRWDDLRDHARYKSLMRKHGFDPESAHESSTASTTRKKMLAVLPFANLSGDPEQEYFSDGMTEEMITRLGRLRPDQLGVIARTSAMRYKKTDKLIDQIGEELGVAYVIEGGVRRAGNSVRINAQLIQVSDQTQLWGDSYTRDLSDVFAVQGEVAEAVAKSLALELLPDTRTTSSVATTGDTAAHDAYLLGRNYWSKRTADDLELAITHFNRAIEIDPGYALAYSGLADTYSVLPGYKKVKLSEVVQRSKEAAQRALAIEPDLAEAHSAIANALFTSSEYVDALRHFRKAIELDPNYSTARQWYSECLSNTGHREESIQQARRAVRLDPQSQIMNYVLGRNLANARRFDDAIAQARLTVKLAPSWAWGYRLLAECYEHAGRYDEAVEAFQNAARLDGTKESKVQELEAAFSSNGIRGVYEWFDNHLKTTTPRPHYPQMAVVAARLGNIDEAFAHMDDALGAQTIITVNPYFDTLRDDPRWDAFLRKAGLPKIEVPDTSSTP